MNPLIDIATILYEKRVTLSLGTFNGPEDWSIFREVVPDSPNRCVVLLTSPSSQPITGLDRSSGISLEIFHFQLRVRGLSKDEIEVVRNKIADYLFSLTRFVRGSYTYEPFILSSGSIPLGVDDRERHSVVQNIQCTRK